MNFLKNNRRSRITLILLSLLLVVIPLYLYSCGGSAGGGYDTFVDPKINVLVDADTLNGWITNGYGGDDSNFNRIVVLHVGDQESYSAGHVPGAYLLDTSTDLASTRSDGVSNTISMVAQKSQMDNLIQRTGIDARTVIVLTGPSGNVNFMLMSRAYFNFRYWGFPRNRVRVLDGFVDTTWTTAGYSLDTIATPAPEASDYSVCNLTPDPDRFRAPLEEMRNIAIDNDLKTVVIDSRSAGQYDGTSPQLVADLDADGTKENVAFSGHIRTAVNQNYTSLLDTDGRLWPKSDADADLTNDLTSIFTGIDVDETTTAYPYCMTSWRAAITFLALDGVLNYPVKIYDGAWIEWGQMTATSSNGTLEATSPWATDYLSSGQSTVEDGAIIIDNTDTEFTTDFAGTASSIGLVPFYGTNYMYDNILNDGSTAVWTPVLTAGYYEVFAWYKSGPAYVSSAEVIINHNSAVDTTSINLQQYGGGWVRLGTYEFAGTGTENVTLSDTASGGNFVIADAVAFLPVGSLASDTITTLSESITYNSSVEDLSVYGNVNSFALHANGVNTEDASICASGDTGGGGGGDTGGY